MSKLMAFRCPDRHVKRLEDGGKTKMVVEALDRVFGGSSSGVEPRKPIPTVDGSPSSRSRLKKLPKGVTRGMPERHVEKDEYAQ